MDAIQEEEEEQPQKPEINSNEIESGAELSEVVIENTMTVEKERGAHIRSDDIEMKTLERNARLRSLDRNLANKLEVRFLA